MTTSCEAPAGSRCDLDPLPDEARRYQRQKFLAEVAATTASLAFLAGMALLAGPRLDAVLRVAIGDGRRLRLLATGAACLVGLEIVTLPIHFWSGFVLEHRHHLSNETLPRWIRRQVKGYLLGGPIGLGLLLDLYSLLWLTGPWWWLWAAAAWLAVILVLGQLVPVVVLPLFYRIIRLQDPTLLARLRTLAEGTGLTVEGVYRWHLSGETRQDNAALAGLGRTRRVLLGDTLLEQLTPEEIEVAFAHEVGHHVYRHMLKDVVTLTVLAAAGFGLVDVVLRETAVALGYPVHPLPAHADPAALPLLLLVLSAFNLVMSPLRNARSRSFEHQCDLYALARTGQPDAYRSPFLKLARLNKSDPDPHPLVVWLFDHHPSIRQRLALAEAPDRPTAD